MQIPENMLIEAEELFYKERLNRFKILVNTLKNKYGYDLKYQYLIQLGEQLYEYISKCNTNKDFLNIMIHYTDTVTSITDIEMRMDI